MKRLSKGHYVRMEMKKQIYQKFGRNPSIPAVYKYNGFTEEKYMDNLQNETRSILTKGMSREELHDVADKVIHQLNTTED